MSEKFDGFRIAAVKALMAGRLGDGWRDANQAMFDKAADDFDALLPVFADVWDDGSQNGRPVFVPNPFRVAAHEGEL